MTSRNFEPPTWRQFSSAVLFTLATCSLASCAAKDEGNDRVGTPTDTDGQTTSPANSTASGSPSASSSSETTAPSPGPSSSPSNTSGNDSSGATTNDVTSSGEMSTSSGDGSDTSSEPSPSSMTGTSDEDSSSTTTDASTSTDVTSDSTGESSEATSDSTDTNATPTDADSGTSGDGEFSPCPTNGDACKILPFGDSITFGMGSESAGHGGYRVHLFELAVGDNRNITFVGSSTAQDNGGPSGPEMVAGLPFPRANEGHSGWRISTGVNPINDRVPSPALDDDPHIILLHIGTNDATMDSGATMASNLATLMDNIIMHAPDALLVVAQIVPFPMSDFGADANARVDAYNALIPDLVQERSASGNHVILADLNTGYDNADFADPVHPNKAGYDFMAERWYEVIKDYLPEAP